jgi:hypothetical protein
MILYTQLSFSFDPDAHRLRFMNFSLKLHENSLEWKRKSLSEKKIIQILFMCLSPLTSRDPGCLTSEQDHKWDEKKHSVRTHMNEFFMAQTAD